ncbi:hypothetical protein K491DRAFT_695747 [Lophiostoma macrostomum CBS 122681]|uniref:Secreted protein n=1 Tax=Lophiostoma macrostomum CBS 122681 TaxID=1314788 RepID=A0A6A6SZ98_9PLEO|nr:hypothetical protein K491DRAFT_695747 [Lophiostoma macrostomum CBS 122681]
MVGPLHAVISLTRALPGVSTTVVVTLVALSQSTCRGVQPASTPSKQTCSSAVLMPANWWWCETRRSPSMALLYR